MKQEKYRYLLERKFSTIVKRSLIFCMLNPSTADETTDDPTIRKCIGFAQRNGYDHLFVLNLYALRGTDPKTVLRHPERIGTLNDVTITLVCSLVKKNQGFVDVLCAWGAHAEKERASMVMEYFKSRKCATFCLGTTKLGFPRHPLYVSYDTEFQIFPNGHITKIGVV